MLSQFNKAAWKAVQMLSYSHKIARRATIIASAFRVKN